MNGNCCKCGGDDCKCTQTGSCQNPCKQLRITNITSTDNRGLAGLRSGSDSSPLVMAYCSNGAIEELSKISASFSAVLDPYNHPDAAQNPQWSSDQGPLKDPGTNLARIWEYTDSGTVTAKTPANKLDAEITIIETEKAEKKWVDDTTWTNDGVIKSFNTWVSALIGYESGLAISGEIKGYMHEVDFYNDGSKLGKKIMVEGSVSASIGADISGSFKFPTSVPGTMATIAVSISNIKFTASSAGGFDESQLDPWGNFSASGSLSAGITGSATIDTAIFISCKGSISSTISGKVTFNPSGQHLTMTPSYEASACHLEFTVTARVLGDITFYEAKGDALPPVTDTLPAKTIF